MPESKEKPIYKSIFVGICQLIIGTVLLLYFTDVGNYVVRQAMVMRQNSYFEKLWADSEIFFKVPFYLFNITNPDDVPKGIPPNLQELGPYSIKVRLIREFEEWDTENALLSVTNRAEFAYDDDQCNDIMSKDITLINLPVIALLGLLQEKFSIFLPFVSASINQLLRHYNQTLIQRYNIKSYLVDGTEIGFLNNLTELVRYIMDLSDILKDNKIGILPLMNSMPSVRLTLHTGAKEPYVMGEVASFMGQSKMFVWRTPHCNMINGSEGATYRFPVTEDDIYLFIGMICRSIKLDYIGDEKLYGIPLRKYGTKSLFTSGLYLPENRCFSCRKRKCDKNGTLSLGPCFPDISFYISTPHFYGGDPILLKMVTGLKPNAKKHEPLLFIYAALGVPLEAQGGIQINFKVKPNKLFPMLENVSEMIIPIAWISMSGGLSSFGLGYLAWFLLIAMPVILRCLSGVMVLLGAIKLYHTKLQPSLHKNERHLSSTKVRPVNTEELTLETAPRRTSWFRKKH